MVFAYSLAVVEDWLGAWAQAWERLRPGGGIAVADTVLPTGRWRVLSPLARVALFTGSVDASRRVWEQVPAVAEQVSRRAMAGGHVQVAAGTKPLADRVQR